MYAEPADKVPTFAFVAWTVIWPLVGPDHLTIYPEMGEPPLLLGAFQLREMALVETPVTFKFCGLDGTAACGTAAMLTFLEA